MRQLIYILIIVFSFASTVSAFEKVTVPIAKTSRLGKVKPDGTTISVAVDGTIAAIAGPIVAPTAYVYVGKNGNDTSGTGSANAPYLTVQKAITASSSGTTIFIWPGTYAENIAMKAGVNLTAPAQYSVYITGNHTSDFTGTVIINNIVLNSTTGVTLAISGTTAQNLQFTSSYINSGTGDAINIVNSHASTKLSITDGNVNVATSGGSARGIYTSTAWAGSIMLNRASVKLNTPANVAVALNGSGAYTHTSDAIYGQSTVANSASATLANITLTSAGAAALTTNSSGTSITLNTIITTDTTPAVAGAGIAYFSAIIYGSTGAGGAATLNGGLGALPLQMAPIRLRAGTLLPAGAVAAGYLDGTFEHDTTGVKFTNSTTRYSILMSANTLLSVTAPTISSGFGTSPSVVANNGVGAFTVNVGTGGTATSGVIGLPTATNGWSCSCNDVTTTSSSVFMCKQTATSATTATIGNFNTSGAATAWTASDVIQVKCMGY